MRILKFLACGAACAACAALAGGAQANPVITSFDYPGTTVTEPLGIDNAGRVVGFYEISGVRHGFRRGANGNMLSFDPPGSVSTIAKSISTGGIVGSYQTSSGGMSHGFLRQPNGSYVTFDPPGSTGTMPARITGNWIAGTYYLGPQQAHGFVRDPSGNIATFDPSGLDSTYVSGINSSGTATGTYIDAKDHSFTRDVSGTVVNADPGPSGSISDGIAANGKISGSHHDGVAFIRHPNGAVQSFTVPGFSTYPDSMSANGDWIVGTYVDTMLRGFVHGPGGTLATFDPAGSTNTSSRDINNAGEAAGWYADSSGALHGFVRTP